MNKLYRYILVGILALIPCFSSADFVMNHFTLNLGYHSDNYVSNSTYNSDLVCFTNPTNCNGIFVYLYQQGQDGTDIGNMYTISNNGMAPMVCASGTNFFNIVSNQSPNCAVEIFTFTSQEYTSLQCQTEYNLIPINSVTTQYCKANFDLISPTECPTVEGTGAVNWTAWYINNEQYPGTASLNIFIPEFLKYSTTYNENQTIVDIEGYNADENYINNVIDQEKLTPTNEDFTNMILTLTGFIPYLFIALLFFWIVRIINRIWK